MHVKKNLSLFLVINLGRISI